MYKKIDKKSALRKSTLELLKARRDHETAISRAEKEDAQKRINHWQNISTKVATMKEHSEIKTFRQFVEGLQRLDEISNKLKTNYISKALPDVKHHSDEYETRRKEVKKKNNGNLVADKKLYKHERKLINRTKGINRAHDTLHRE